MNATSTTTTTRVTQDAPAQHERSTMKAIVQDVYGSADVLRLDDVETPPIGDAEVLVRVRAAGVDRGAVHLMTGTPYLLRIAGFGLRAPKGRVRGREVAGVVEAVGKDVTRFAAGDGVMGIAEGAFAEYAAAREDRLTRAPAGITFGQAAAVPISGITALQAVRDHGRVQAGQKVLVLGASGGVGTFAVQLAKAAGAEVTGACRTSKMDVVRSIGADHVIDYTREDPTGAGRRYDVILDIGGNRPLSHLRRALAPRGTLVIVGGEDGGRWTGGMHRQMGALAISPFVGQRLTMFVARENGDDLDALVEHVEAGSVVPLVDRSYALDEAPRAMRDLADGRARGKLVVTVGPDR